MRKFLSREGEVYILNPALDVRHGPEGAELFDTAQNATLPLLPHQRQILAEVLRTRIIDEPLATFFIHSNFFIQVKSQ